MKIRVNKTAEYLSGLIIFLLFPVFFFYHFALALGLIPSLFGGWYGIMSVISLFAILPFGALAFLNEKYLPLQILLIFSLLVLLVGSWAGIHYFLGTDWHKSFAAFKGSGAVIIFWTVLFFTGYFVQNRKWFLTLLSINFGLMSLIILLNIDFNRMMFDAKQQFSVSEGVASYQGFARSMVVVAVILLAFHRSRLWQFFVLGLGVVTLFFIGARSEFFGFLAVGAVWLWIIFLRDRFSFTIMVVALLIIFLLFIFLFGDVQSSRQLQVLDLSLASSWQARIVLLREGWDDIYSSPILGEYASQLKTRGFGSYIHNVLSAWRQFGIFGFSLYFVISIISFLLAFRAVILKGRQSDRWLVALYMNTLCLSLIIVAKSIFWGLPALAWGLSTGALAKDRFYIPRDLR